MEQAEDFLWGVATSAYQAEGGYNGPGQPETNWAAAERRGDVAVCGEAAGFWQRFGEDFARCAAMGLNAFRLGIEWSRLWPRRAGEFCHAALDHYASLLGSCRSHGLEPVVTLHHFVHPAWAGSDPWLGDETPTWFAQFARDAVEALNERLEKPLRWFITINEPNMLVLNTYLGRQFPSRVPSGFPRMLRAYNQILRAHLMAYRALHRLYEARGWERPRITFNNYCSDLYWSDKMLLDLVCARERGVPRERVGAEICSRAAAFDHVFREAHLPLRRDLAFYFGDGIKRLSNWLGYRKFSASDFAPLLDTLYAGDDPRPFDYIGLDYYDPFAAHAFRLPVLWDHEFKNRSFRSWVLATVTSKWWDWRVLPAGLHFFCQHYAQDFARPVLIAENGMAIRRRADNRHIHERRDKITRSEFLRRHVAEVRRIREEGIPLLGYLHWSLFDNYEWGSFTPRFGLFSLDYTRGLDRCVEDPWGDRPSETYARLIREARQ
jgi:beta-glucosidase/6-phospho-beta-glucosidase/beta-galactosidase